MQPRQGRRALRSDVRLLPSICSALQQASAPPGWGIANADPAVAAVACGGAFPLPNAVQHFVSPARRLRRLVLPLVAASLFVGSGAMACEKHLNGHQNSSDTTTEATGK
jgi:hypothetical protein